MDTIHTCSYHTQHPCLRCQSERKSADEAQAFYRSGEDFLRKVADSLPEDIKNQNISPSVVYLLGQAVAYGRSQERQNGLSPAGGCPDPIQRFAHLDFDKSE